MSPMMAYMGNDSDRLTCWLNVLDSEISVDFAPEEMDGWGVGYFTGDRALSIKRPHTTRAWKFTDELKDIDSKVALWHIVPQDETIAAYKLDVLPLHFGSWLFICEGSRPLVPETQKDLKAHLGDHFQRKLRGQGTGEYLFYWILQGLQKGGWLDTPPAQLASLVENVRTHMTQFAEQWMPDGRLSETAAVLTNGRQLVAFSRDGKMYISFKEGLAECAHCGPGKLDDFSVRESHNRSRAVMVIHGLSPIEAGTAWQSVSSETIMAIDRDLSTHHFRWPIQ